MFCRKGKVSDWSECSRYMFSEAEKSCLTKPEKLFGAPTCGNNIIEEGEECDCGSPEHCTRLK